MKRKLALMKSSSAAPTKPGAKGLLMEVRQMILATRQTVAQGANSALATLYWEIGRRVRSAAGVKGSYRIDHSPPDVLGIYIFLPVAKL